MHFVHRHGCFEPVRLISFVKPVVIVPLKISKAPDDGSRLWADFMVESDRVSFFKQVPALSSDRVLVACSREDALDDPMPDTVVAGIQPVVSGSPTIAVRDDRNLTSIGRPDSESNTAVQQMCAPVAVQSCRIGHLIKCV